MQSKEHKLHIKTRISHSDCCECRADTERSFVDRQEWRYQFVHDYLEHVRPRLAAIKTQKYSSDVDAIIWYRKFIKALHTRISQKVPNAGRKYCDSYLERCGQFPRSTDAGYLRQFASRGASCLDY